MKRSLTAQIAEVEREIGLRRKVYPTLVSKHTMKQGAADEHLLLMECALETLKWLYAHRDDVLAKVKDEVAAIVREAVG